MRRGGGRIFEPASTLRLTVGAHFAFFFSRDRDSGEIGRPLLLRTICVKEEERGKNESWMINNFEGFFANIVQ